EARTRPGALDIVEPRKLDAEHLLVEEQERALRLVLRRRGHAPLDRQRRQEGLDLACTESGRMAFAVEHDEAPDPVAVRLLGAKAVVLEPDPVTDAVEQ